MRRLHGPIYDWFVCSIVYPSDWLFDQICFFFTRNNKKKAARYDRNQCLGWKTINVLLEKTKPWNLVHATWTLAVYVKERDLELLK